MILRNHVSQDNGTALYRMTDNAVISLTPTEQPLDNSLDRDRPGGPEIVI